MPAKSKVKVGPPPKRNRRKWPFVGTIRFAGMVIYVENLSGQVREGTGPGGKKWRTKMKCPYGEILKTKGTDGDKVDVYVGPNPLAKKVYVVNQNHPKGHPRAGKFDEQKVMLGFSNAAAAKRAYLAHYDSDSFFRSITEMDIAQFKASVFGEDKGEKVAAYRSGFERAIRTKLAAISPEELAAYDNYPAYGALGGMGLGGALGTAIGYALKQPGLGAVIGAPVGGLLGLGLPFLSERVRAAHRASSGAADEVFHSLDDYGVIDDGASDQMQRSYDSALQRALRTEAAKLS